MTFFEDIGRKTVEATAKLSQQARDLSETAQLQNLIAREEQKIQAAYLLIGKIYLANHRDDYEEEYADPITAIKQAEDQIVKNWQQIQVIRGVVWCPQCGEEISKDVVFCPHCGMQVVKQGKGVECFRCHTVNPEGMHFCSECGAPLPQKDSSKAEEKRVCGKCHREVPKNGVFCPYCGNRLVEEKAGYHSHDAKQVVQIQGDSGAAYATPNLPRICPDCGALLAEDIQFCTECGKKL